MVFRIRRNTSDNLFHWEFMLKADKVEVSISGKCPAVQLRVSEEMTDENWRHLILAIKSDYKKTSLPRKRVSFSRHLENWVIYPNRYVAIADLCADLKRNSQRAWADIRTTARNYTNLANGSG